MTKTPIFQTIAETISSLNTDAIPEKRKTILKPLAIYIKAKSKNGDPIALNFICTHNSRRSHLSQIWAQTLAYYAGIENISCYSGGTEATAFFPVAVETMKNMGFEINILSESDNPIYSIKFAENAPPIIGFSKTFDNPFNPKSDFAAIMTCDSANEACPVVSGSDERFSITYKDPKAFDNTPLQKEKYLERSLQIATELKWVFLESNA